MQTDFILCGEPGLGGEGAPAGPGHTKKIIPGERPGAGHPDPGGAPLPAATSPARNARSPTGAGPQRRGLPAGSARSRGSRGKPCPALWAGGAGSGRRAACERGPFPRRGHRRWSPAGPAPGPPQPGAGGEGAAASSAEAAGGRARPGGAPPAPGLGGPRGTRTPHSLWQRKDRPGRGCAAPRSLTESQRRSWVGAVWTLSVSSRGRE